MQLSVLEQLVPMEYWFSVALEFFALELLWWSNWFRCLCAVGDGAFGLVLLTLELSGV
jgi:hypothetical protein